MRRCAWEIGARWPLGTVSETNRYVTLAPVAPTSALSTWNIDKAWVGQRSSERGEAWQGARLILRLYDVSSIEFNGFNANRMIDVELGQERGETFVSLPRGSNQLAEVGFLLRSGEFLPAARSVTITLPAGAPSHRADRTWYFVDDKLKPEIVATPDHQRKTENRSYGDDGPPKASRRLRRERDCSPAVGRDAGQRNARVRRRKCPGAI